MQKINIQVSKSVRVCDQALQLPLTIAFCECGIKEEEDQEAHEQLVKRICKQTLRDVQCMNPGSLPNPAFHHETR